ncbi:MAG: imidazole glycerol phosphate synthase subunit HisH [Nitriliruptorales bacterium]|nr:imidazole glycerol phosphate synthase subunit HisH [Nitriliruptorales bacterium]
MTRPRVAVLDYQAGNVRSAQRGLSHAGADAFVTEDPDEAADADALVVPGVGHFGTCLAELRSLGLEAVVRNWIDEDRPALGICVGLQLLYEHSEEGDVTGLGVLPGTVVRFPADVTVPHMGWDVIEAADGHDGDPALEGVAGERCYFVHSYYAVPSDDAHVVAVTDYGGASFPSVVRVNNVLGTQFHPEKSGPIGARFLSNWVATLS